MSNETPEAIEPAPLTDAQVMRLNSPDVLPAVGQALAGASSEDYDPVVHNRRATAAINEVVRIGRTEYVDPEAEPVDPEPVDEG